MTSWAALRLAAIVAQLNHSPADSWLACAVVAETVTDIAVAARRRPCDGLNVVAPVAGHRDAGRGDHAIVVSRNTFGSGHRALSS